MAVAIIASPTARIAVGDDDARVSGGDEGSAIILVVTVTVIFAIIIKTARASARSGGLSGAASSQHPNTPEIILLRRCGRVTKEFQNSVRIAMHARIVQRRAAAVVGQRPSDGAQRAAKRQIVILRK